MRLRMGRPCTVDQLSRDADGKIGSLVPIACSCNPRTGMGPVRKPPQNAPLENELARASQLFGRKT
jgi:hypothetical protein